MRVRTAAGRETRRPVIVAPCEGERRDSPETAKMDYPGQGVKLTGTRVTCSTLPLPHFRCVRATPGAGLAVRCGAAPYRKGTVRGLPDSSASHDTTIAVSHGWSSPRDGGARCGLSLGQAAAGPRGRGTVSPDPTPAGVHRATGGRVGGPTDRACSPSDRAGFDRSARRRLQRARDGGARREPDECHAVGQAGG